MIALKLYGIMYGMLYVFDMLCLMLYEFDMLCLISVTYLLPPLVSFDQQEKISVPFAVHKYFVDTLTK